ISSVPVLGHAVQAPSAMLPNAAPWVSANHVAPSPMAAASENESSDPNSSRTERPSHHVNYADAPGAPKSNQLPRTAGARRSSAAEATEPGREGARSTCDAA